MGQLRLVYDESVSVVSRRRKSPAVVRILISLADVATLLNWVLGVTTCAVMMATIFTPRPDRLIWLGAVKVGATLTVVCFAYRRRRRIAEVFTRLLRGK